MEFSQILKNLMENNQITPNKMSNYRLAQLIGVSQTTVANWLSGSTIPDSKKLKEIADLFNVSTDYLLGNDIKNTPKTPEAEDIIILNRVAKQLEPTERKKLIEMAKILLSEDFDDNDRKS